MTAHKHAALMMQYAQDAQETETPWERWQVLRDGTWYTMLDYPLWHCSLEYRRKPKTIRIGEFDVPEPVREPLEEGQKCWTPDVPFAARELVWCGGSYDKFLLEAGLIHLTREAAQQHVDALLSFTRRK